MLTRSSQQGAVEVTGDGLRGRVFVGKGGIDLATTWGDEDLHRHLVNSGLAEESALRRILSAETTLAAIAESNQGMIDLLREMTVESIYQIGHRGDEFEVHEGMTTPYASPKTFDLESLLQDAAQREQDWARVNDVVPDLATSIGFRRDLGQREEVTVRVDDWKVLSEIGSGSSISEIAEHLGTTEFWTARVAARLLENDLVTVSAPYGTTSRSETHQRPDDRAEPESPAYQDYSDDPDHGDYPEYPREDAYGSAEPYESPRSEETPEEEPSPVYEEYEPETPPVEEEPAAEAAPAATADEDVDPDESWWREPEDEAESVDGPATGEEDRSEAAGTDEDAHVEEDTEAFLEKVFSELESSEPAQEPEEEGHGLLRRRRMGMLRDFSSDS